MSLNVPKNRKVISAFKDPNTGKKPGVRNESDPLAVAPPAIEFRPAFLAGQQYTAPHLYEFARKATKEWFPPDNFTKTDISGSLLINGLNVGKIEFKVLPSQTVTNDMMNSIFTTNPDTYAAGLFVKGNLQIGETLSGPCTLQPPTRKLFTIIYVTGDLILASPYSKISMSQRGANHSGTGVSAGLTTEVNIQVGPNTKISANGGAGANGPNANDGTSNQGSNGSTDQNGLQTGGGGGGWWDFKTEL